MVLFKVKGKEGVYPFVVLNGNNFYLKAQEVIVGFNQYREYPTLNEELEDLKLEVLKIDVEPNMINKELRKLYKDKNIIGEFHPIYEKTIEKHYSKIYVHQNLDFFLNLRDTYSKLDEIIFFFIYKGVSKEWVAAVYEIDMIEINFILENLPIYYNFIEFGEELWHT